MTRLIFGSDTKRNRFAKVLTVMLILVGGVRNCNVALLRFVKDEGSLVNLQKTQCMPQWQGNNLLLGIMVGLKKTCVTQGFSLVLAHSPKVVKQFQRENLLGPPGFEPRTPA